MKKIKEAIVRLINYLMPSQNSVQAKEKWEQLAKENAGYYIVSKFGKGINEHDFNDSGALSYQQIIIEDEILKQQLQNFSDKKVLDIGCGSGRLMQFFSKDFQEASGVDISEKMIDLAKERLQGLSNVVLKSNDGEKYPFNDNYFDLVFSYLVFQHMASREVVKKNLQEVYRVLSNNGIAKIQIRGGSQPAKWMWYYGPSFSLNEATEMVNGIGFKIIKTEGENKKRFWLWLKK